MECWSTGVKYWTTGVEYWTTGVEYWIGRAHAPIITSSKSLRCVQIFVSAAIQMFSGSKDDPIVLCESPPCGGSNSLPSYMHGALSSVHV